jgi:hypothetical protein
MGWPSEAAASLFIFRIGNSRRRAIDAPDVALADPAGAHVSDPLLDRAIGRV